MLTFRILHVIGNIVWLGGGIAAALAMATLASENKEVRLAAAKALRKIVLTVVTPGMLLSIVGMAFAALGVLSPVAGAIAQEAIDLLAVLNALRTARSPSVLTDFEGPRRANS